MYWSNFGGGWASFRATFGSYDEAREFADTERARKLAYETYLIDSDAPARFHILFHSTRIVTYHANGSVSLNCGGWRTPITRHRMNAFLPKRRWNPKAKRFEGFGAETWQQSGFMYLTVHDAPHFGADGSARTYAFADDITIDCTGLVTHCGVPCEIADPDQDARDVRNKRARERSARTRRERYVNALIALKAARDEYHVIALDDDTAIERQRAVLIVCQAERKAERIEKLIIRCAERAGESAERFLRDARERFEGRVARERAINNSQRHAFQELDAARARVERRTPDAPDDTIDAAYGYNCCRGDRGAAIAEAARRILARDEAAAALDALEAAKRAERERKCAEACAADAREAYFRAAIQAEAAPDDERAKHILKHATLWDGIERERAIAAKEKHCEALRLSQELDSERAAAQLARAADVTISYDEITALCSAIRQERKANGISPTPN